MGCVSCGRRQVDPDSGPSAWRRAVVAGNQVLVCPDCQGDGWTDALDRCADCGSTMLVKRLGEVTCRGCGASGVPLPGPEPVQVRRSSPELLRDEISAALDRVLRTD